MATRIAPTVADIREARERIGERARVTPLYGSETLSREAGRRVVLKAENLQHTGSFKIRGVYNVLALLSPAERAAGVVAASAGNHGQAVAWAARELGLRATIFMPEDAPMAKVEATYTYGAEVVLVGSDFDAALAEARHRVEETGAGFAHAFAAERGNIVAIRHHREGMSIDVAETAVELTVVTRNEEHCRRLLSLLAEHGFPVERLR